MKIITEKDRVLSESILQFIDTPLFNIRRLEELCDVPKNTISSRALTTRLIPSQHLFKMVKFLAGYGFQMNGYDLKVVDDRLVAEKVIESKTNNGLVTKQVIVQIWEGYDDL